MLQCGLTLQAWPPSSRLTPAADSSVNPSQVRPAQCLVTAMSCLACAAFSQMGRLTALVMTEFIECNLPVNSALTPHF